MKRSDIHRTAMTAAETQNSSGDSHHERRLVIGHSLNISLRSRIRIERFAHAFLCRESSIVTALTILGTPAALMASHIGVVPDWTWIACLLFGVLSIGALAYTSATDPEVNRRVVAEALQRHYGFQRLKDTSVRQQVARAFDYRGRIEAVMLGRGGATVRAALSETVVQIDGWLSSICRLAERLDALQGEARFQQSDKAQAQQRVTELQEKARTDTDEKMGRNIRGTLAGLMHQLWTIEQLEQAIEGGQLQLEHAVTALGTIYSQTVLLGARGADAGAARQLSLEISEEANQVDAILSAMERIQNVGSDDDDWQSGRASLI